MLRTIFLISAVSAVKQRGFSPGGGIRIRRNLNILVLIEKLGIGLLLLYRRARYGYPYRRIRLAGPRYVKVDPEDYERLKEYEWYPAGHGRYVYANRPVRAGRAGRSRLLAMHREIIDAGQGKVVDHINMDTTDNRKANLREATRGQNQANRKKVRVPTTSRYKGVCRPKGRRKWNSQIDHEGKKIFLGTFDDEIEAGKAYDEAAKKYFGEFAYLNFPESTMKVRKK